MSISLHIEAASAPELWAALTKLLEAAQGNGGSADCRATDAQAPLPAIAPAEAPALTLSPADGATPYDIAMLANASRTLVTAGRQAELTALLREFGVARLADVPPQRYGEYALGLRALGIEP